MQRAVGGSGIAKRATCHPLRYSHATHLLEVGCVIRTLHEQPGYTDVRTTMIYTHVLDRGKWVGGAESGGPAGWGIVGMTALLAGWGMLGIGSCAGEK